MLNKSLSMILLLAVSAAAQSAPATKTTAAKAAPNTKKAAITSKPASQTVTVPPAKSAKATAKRVAPVKGAPAPVKVAKQSPAMTPAAAKAPAGQKVAGRRDPFVSPLRLQEDRLKSSSLCTTGARCLIIEQVDLKGIVKTPQGMIAMVENAAKKQYNLREKDPVLNGQVLKITGDSLIFRETVTDNLGNQTTKEVVKKVTAPVI